MCLICMKKSAITSGTTPYHENGPIYGQFCQQFFWEKCVYIEIVMWNMISISHNFLKVFYCIIKVCIVKTVLSILFNWNVFQFCLILLLLYIYKFLIFIIVEGFSKYLKTKFNFSKETFGKFKFGISFATLFHEAKRNIIERLGSIKVYRIIWLFSDGL